MVYLTKIGFKVFMKRFEEFDKMFMIVN